MGWRAEGALARLVAALLFLLAAVPASQAQLALLQPYQEDVGLTSLSVTSLSQDRRGMLWIATANGLYRFDGFRAQREPLPRSAGQEADTVLADRWGRLWVVTESGLFVRRADGDWSAVYTGGQAPLDVESGHRLDLDDKGLLYVIDREQRLWIVDAGTAPASPIHVHPLALPAHEASVGTRETISGPLLVSGNSLWFGCGAGLCEWRDQRLRLWREADGLPARPWASLLRGRDGAVWARSSDTLARLNAGGQRFEAEPAPVANKWPGSIALAEDSGGAILTATDEGVARWDGRRWHSWDEREGMPQTAVRALLFDAEGELWLSAMGRGFYRWVGYGQVDHWTEAQGLPSAVVTSLARDGAGRLWAGTGRGTAFLDADTQRFHPVGGSVPVGRVDGIARDASGALWWTQGPRLLHVRPPETVAHLVADEPTIAAISQGTDGAYLLSSRKVERLDSQAKGFRREQVETLPVSGRTFIQMQQDGSTRWLFADSRVVRVGPDGRLVPLRDATGHELEAYLNPAFVGPGHCWVADFGGLAEYRLDHDTAHLLRRIDASRFGSPATIFLQASPDGRLWYGTDHGLFVLDHERWTHLDRSNGLLWNDLNWQGFLLDGNGSVWLGTSAGITHWRPRKTAPEPIRLRVDEWRVGKEAMLSRPDRPIEWAQRRLQLTLGTPNLARARSLQVEYRLDGDEHWHGLEGNVLVLEAVEAGWHHLQLRATGPLGLDEGQPLHLAFEVQSPWWARTPARLAGFLALALLWWASAFFLNRRALERRRALECAIAERTAQLEASRAALRDLGAHNARALEDERKRVARELHDELGQQLAALRMEVAVQRLQAGTGDPAGQGLWEGLLRRVDHLMSSMRSLVTQLRPPALDGGLGPALRWLASEFSRDTGVDCVVDIAPDAGKLPTDIATMVFRIVQESLNNVRRHAHASRAELTLRREGNDWVLTVKDDGRGFDLSTPRSGYGLLGMEERALLVGGSLEIDSAPGKGSTVTLRVSNPTQS
jgi:signal transduction histidine kinase/ligand-binding sensor domain-containing protein